MPSEWRAFWDRWTDERGWVLWIMPLSAIAIFVMTLVIGVSIDAISTEDFGDKYSKKIILLGFGVVLFVGGIYMCVGAYQLFFLELRHKFIARSIVWNGKGYELKGYYFKQASFTPADLSCVEEYRVDHRYFGGTILTLLNRIPKVNYRVRLKDGRVFYLPADIGRVDQLKAQLESDIRENTQ